MFCRVNMVAVLIQARPPTQPFTLGGWNSSCPMRSPASTSRSTLRTGVPRLRTVCTISCVGLLMMVCRFARA